MVGKRAKKFRCRNNLSGSLGVDIVLVLMSCFAFFPLRGASFLLAHLSIINEYLSVVSYHLDFLAEISAISP